jgi:hypothetical protein
MRTAKPQAPSAIAGYAGATIRCVPDGRGTIGIMIMVMVMTTVMAIAAGSPARIIVPVNGSIAQGQSGRAKDGGVGAGSWNDGCLALHHVGRRRLAFPAMTQRAIMTHVQMIVASARPLAAVLVNAVRAGPRMLAGRGRHMLCGG